MTPEEQLEQLKTLVKTLRPLINTESDKLYDNLTGMQKFSVVTLSMYCVILIVIPTIFLYKWYEAAVTGSLPELKLFELVIALAIMGSAARGVSNLFLDVGNKRYQGNWSLSILMRPVEGIVLGVATYIGIRGGVVVLTQDVSMPNPLVFFLVAILSGMFSHKAADGLREWFVSIFSGKSSG